MDALAQQVAADLAALQARAAKGEDVRTELAQVRAQMLNLDESAARRVVDQVVAVLLVVTELGLGVALRRV